MTTIVLNTATAAVTEYDWGFQSMTAQRAGGAAAGLCTLGGDNDAGAPITGEFRSGKPAGETLMAVGNVYVAAKGAGDGVLIIEGAEGSWEYPVAHRGSSISKVKPGRGIREPRLGFGYRNAAGADFHIERIDVEIQETKTRRV